MLITKLYENWVIFWPLAFFKFINLFTLSSSFAFLLLRISKYSEIIKTQPDNEIVVVVNKEKHLLKWNKHFVLLAYNTKSNSINGKFR